MKAIMIDLQIWHEKVVSSVMGVF